MHTQFSVSDPENIESTSESVDLQTAVIGVVQNNRVSINDMLKCEWNDPSIHLLSDRVSPLDHRTC